MVSIIIVGYNSLQHVKNCLQSIMTHPPPGDFEIIYIDNASSDDSIDYIQKNHPRVILIKNEENRGFQKGCNQGLSIAKGDYLILLNTDTIILPHTFQLMLDSFQNNPQIGSASPKCLYPDGRIQWGKAHFPTIRDFLHWLCTNHKFLKYLISRKGAPPVNLDVNQEQDYTYGAFFMIPKKVFNAIGPMDENFFMAGGDIAWSMKIKKKGWKNYYIGRSHIIHNEKESSRRQDPFSTQIDWIRSHRYLLYRYGNPFKGFLCDLIFLLHILLGTSASLLGKWKNNPPPLSTKEWLLTFKSIYLNGNHQFRHTCPSPEKKWESQ